jgi:hypothetical protein
MKRPNATQSLYRLIYCSLRVLAPPADGPDTDLLDIVASARAHNDSDGVTSVLLVTGTGYAHVLEGPRDTLEHTFDRIAEDERHSEVTMLSFTPTERRRFPDQPVMLIDGLPAGISDPLGGLKPDPVHDRPRLTTGGDIVRLIERIVQARAEATA